MNLFPLILLLLLLTGGYSQDCLAENKQECDSCSNYYFFDEKCLPCGQAKDEYLCEQCEGYYYHEKNCLPCKDVANPSLCNQCRGYFFEDGKCLPCEIASPYMCSLQCQDYYLNKGQCTHCSQITDELTCKFCVGKFEFKKGKCVQCPKHYTIQLLSYQCLSCSGLSHPLLCKTCDEYFFFNSTCQKCIKAKTNTTCMLCPQFFFNGSACKHCNEATQNECSSCSNHVFINDFCVPCRLVNNSEACSSGCKLFRYSTDRMMCVPCSKKGYFLNQNNTCEHCLNANNTNNCNLCRRFSFDRKDRACLNCSEITDPYKCQNCLGYFYSKELKSCRPCENATMMDCLVNCKNHFYKSNCTSCLHARSIFDCRNCGAEYYWSKSGKCLSCLYTDFFIREDECVPCSQAKNAQECELCQFHFISRGKCTPCKLAKNIYECNSCRRLNFFFTASNKCELCVLATEKDCNYQKCPGFLFTHSKCTRPQKIVSKAICIKHPFFSFNSTEGCQYCVAPNQFLDPLTNICFKCQSFKNFANCSKCIEHYFNNQSHSCISCSTTKNQSLCSLCVSHVFLTIGSRCTPCRDVTKSSDCQQCKGYFYRKGLCLQCKHAESNYQCKMCDKHGFQSLTCVRCEKINNMDNCERQCASQGYYPARNIELCLSCDFAETQAICSNCITHTWSTSATKCLSCNVSEVICQSCGGKYWENNQCRQCNVTNCRKCTNGTVCTQCRASYSLGTNNKTCTKICKANYCSKCAHNSSQFCELCHPDYNFEASKGLCSLECLVTRCLTCLSNSVCQVCEQGYSLSEDGSQCLCSIKNCDSCQFALSNLTNSSASNLICNRCLLGYQYDTQQKVCKRIQCDIQNCSVCRNLTACEVCQLGWNVDSKRVCKKICNISLCTVCSSPKTCETCVKGYTLINDKQCLPFCNIKNCIKCKDESVCQACELEYSINSNFTKCELLCPKGLSLLKGVCNDCQKAISFCERCSQVQKKAVCSKCISGYVSTDGSCSLCSFWKPNCNNCTRNSSNSIICLSCSFGYSLINSKCSKCASNCHNCTNNGEDDCDFCIEGYVYNTNTFNEIKCIPCLNSNCLNCHSSNISLCLVCSNGYYLKKNMCNKCSSNCKKCNETVCTLCQENYFLNEGNCIIRIDYCLLEVISSNKSYCRMCKSGYELVGSQCRVSRCSESYTCKACPDSQYLSNGLCLNCPTQKCQKCNELIPSKCLSCAKGYFLQNNSSCSQCSAACDLCTSGSSCQMAAKGYFLWPGNNKPVKCPSTCQQCNNTYLCLACSKGYFLFKFKCLSEQSINMTITVTPLSKEWQRLNKSSRYEDLLQRWNFYYSQLLKLIGYQDRWNLVYVNSVVTGSITYNLVIDKLPSEDFIKVAQHIDGALKAKSDILQLVTYQKEGIHKKQSSNEAASSSNTLVIVLMVLASIIFCVIAFFCLKRLLTTRIAPISDANIIQQSKTYNKFVFDKNPQKVSEGSNGGKQQSKEPSKKSQISQQLPKLQNHTQINSQ